MGRWESPHSIWLTEFVVQAGLKITYQHEMLHDLLQTGSHPAEFNNCRV